MRFGLALEIGEGKTQINLGVLDCTKPRSFCLNLLMQIVGGCKHAYDSIFAVRISWSSVFLLQRNNSDAKNFGIIDAKSYQIFSLPTISLNWHMNKGHFSQFGRSQFSGNFHPLLQSFYAKNSILYEPWLYLFKPRQWKTATPSAL